MPDLLTTGPDDIIRVYRYNITHTPTGERCEGGPFEVLGVMFHGARNVIIHIPKKAVQRDGTPTCVPGLILLRDELNKIIEEYAPSQAYQNVLTATEIATMRALLAKLQGVGG